jgi:hypothetical protein
MWGCPPDDRPKTDDSIKAFAAGKLLSHKRYLKSTRHPYHMNVLFGNLMPL